MTTLLGQEVLTVWSYTPPPPGSGAGMSGSQELHIQKRPTGKHSGARPQREASRYAYDRSEDAMVGGFPTSQALQESQPPQVPCLPSASLWKPPRQLCAEALKTTPSHQVGPCTKGK